MLDMLRHRMVLLVSTVTMAALLFLSIRQHEPCIDCSVSAAQTELSKAIQHKYLHDPNQRCGDKTAYLDKYMAGLTGDTVSPDDPRLLNVLLHHVIDPPSPWLPKMSYPLFKTPQAEAVDKILFAKQSGFFLECGALDGERSSNTIYLEQKRGWTGLLVEMDPSWYLQIRGKNRKSYTINACISPYQYPIKMDYKEHVMGEGKLVMPDSPSGGARQRQVYCFPLYSMLLALNRTHIDYFSLDVEGLELDILRTIPFEKLDISILTVEYKHSSEGNKAYENFMASKGYYVHSKIKAFKPEIYFGCRDYVFVKKGLKLH